jgi:hypothetical protein
VKLICARPQVIGKFYEHGNEYSDYIEDGELLAYRSHCNLKNTVSFTGSFEK